MMKKFVVIGALLATAFTPLAQAALQDGLISYWPLDDVIGTKTPDLINGLDMELVNLTRDDLVDGLPGNGKAMQFENARQTMLKRVSNPGEKLPINQYPALTIAMWANVVGTGNNDLRLFSEGSTENNNPLFNLGTANDGASGRLDFYFRQAGWAEVNHLKSDLEPLDGTWHHIVFTQAEDGSRNLYIDGLLDTVVIPAKEAGTWNVNTTTLGGILRANPTHWLNGALDEVMLWSRDLTAAEVQQVYDEGLSSIFPPLVKGMVAYYPLDEVEGVRTPDAFNDYDMELVNLTAADLVPGKIGQAMQFENARQTMLQRINSEGDQLPINQYQAFSIAMWANVVGTGNNDLRLFSEGSTLINDPLFNLGTASTGDNGTLDFFFRQSGWPTVDHLRSLTEPLDGTWHHIVFVQREDLTRDLYVDGVLDGVQIPAKPDTNPWNVNTTTLGGIRRANPTHWLNGTLDDVALWNRALDPAEIQEIATTGIPPFTPPAPPPLAIRSFQPDLQAVADGDSVTLRWDVTKNVQVIIDQGVGDVTGNTISGLGSVAVTPNGTRTYTLTLSRSGEAPITAQTTVTVIDQVENGWTLIDNFDRLEPGPIQQPGSPWADLTATGIYVTNRNGNHMAVPMNAGVAAVLQLGDNTIKLNQERTVFCRLMVSDDDISLTWNGVLGVSDRPFRFGTDIDNEVDLGPAIYCLYDLPSYPAFLGSANGPGGAITLSPTPVIENNTQTFFNIWIDITNGPFIIDGTTGTSTNTGDIFTIYAQMDGDTAPREAIVTGYYSSRDPVGAPDVGLTQEALNRLVIGGRAALGSEDITQQNMLFDDIYISQDGFLDTVPRPSGFSEPVVAADPPVMTVQKSGTDLEIAWDYGVLESSATVNGTYSPVPGASAPSYSVTPSEQQQFYRVNGN